MPISWFNQFYNYIVSWFKEEDRKRLEYLDLEDDFFEPCKILSQQDIDNFSLTQSLPNTQKFHLEANHT